MKEYKPSGDQVSYSLGLPHTETMSCIMNGSSIEKSALLDRHFSEVWLLSSGCEESRKGCYYAQWGKCQISPHSHALCRFLREWLKLPHIKEMQQQRLKNDYIGGGNGWRAIFRILLPLYIFFAFIIIFQFYKKMTKMSWSDSEHVSSTKKSWLIKRCVQLWPQPYWKSQMIRGQNCS